METPWKLRIAITAAICLVGLFARVHVDRGFSKIAKPPATSALQEGAKADEVEVAPATDAFHHMPDGTWMRGKTHEEAKRKSMDMGAFHRMSDGSFMRGRTHAEAMAAMATAEATPINMENEMDEDMMVEEKEVVQPVVSAASKQRATLERARLKARMEKKVKVTIAGAKRQAMKARDDAKLARAKAKLKNKMTQAKQKAAKHLQDTISKEAETKSQVKLKKAELNNKIKLMFQEATAVTVKEKAKLKVEAAALQLKLKTKMIGVKANILAKKAAATAVVTKAHAAWKAEELSTKTVEKGKRQALQDKLKDIRSKDKNWSTANAAVVVKEKAVKAQKAALYSVKLSKRTAAELKDKVWARKNNPFRQRYQRMSHRFARRLRKDGRKRHRAWRRKVTADVAMVSRIGRRNVRAVKTWARQANKAIHHYAAKKELKDGDASEEGTQVQRIRATARHAEFEFDATQDAANEAVEETLKAHSSHDIV